jgi:hypothetical protein
MRLTVSIVALVVLASSAGCARSAPLPSSSATSAASAKRNDDQRPVYRLEFALRAKDDAATAPSTTFVIQVADRDTGEMMVGKNIPLPSLQPGGPSPRQDVGLKVKAHVRERAPNDLLVDVSTELSASESTSVRKVVSHGSVRARPGAQALVSRVADDTQTYELLVTASRVD